MLEKLFSPESIAVIGASKTVGKVGYDTVSNLVKSGFPGPIIPVNSAGGELFGLKVYPQIADYPHAVDLVVIAVPAEMVPAAAKEAVKKKAGAIVVVASGFKETGAGTDRDLPQRRGAALGAQLFGGDQHLDQVERLLFQTHSPARPSCHYFPVRRALYRHDGYCR